LDQKLAEARILVVDDDRANVDLLRRVLEPQGYTHIRTTSDPLEAPEIFEEFEPDLVLLDLWMPGMDGFQLMEALRERTPGGVYVPILVITSDSSQDAKRRALAGGARDFLPKPLSPAEVRLRIRNLLETRFLHRALEEHNRSLEERVRKRTADLEAARLEVLRRLARAAEYRDDETGEHTRRVGRTSGRIGRALGLPRGEVELIETVAPLHDLGKIGIPDRILMSPTRLSADDFEVMKTHTIIGWELLRGSGFRLLDTAAQIARSHHEHWDGKGYPDGLSGNAIPLAGRIVALADTFDALIHSRPYKRAWSRAEALAEIEAGRGKKFDPDVVDAFDSITRRSTAASAP
jgi:putative two-component system response regulator